MRARVHAPLLIALSLLFVSLACSLSARGQSEVVATLNLPTPVPSMPPPSGLFDPKPGGTPPTLATEVRTLDYPMVLKASGTKVDFSTAANNACQTPALVAMTIFADGTVELSSTGLSFIDHINCTTSNEETYIISGSVDLNETVNFKSCNFGNFRANGSLAYGGGALQGEVTCTDKIGDSMTLTIP